MKFKEYLFLIENEILTEDIEKLKKTMKKLIDKTNDEEKIKSIINILRKDLYINKLENILKIKNFTSSEINTIKMIFNSTQGSPEEKTNFLVHLEKKNGLIDEQKFKSLYGEQDIFKLLPKSLQNNFVFTLYNKLFNAIGGSGMYSGGKGEIAFILFIQNGHSPKKGDIKISNTIIELKSKNGSFGIFKNNLYDKVYQYAKNIGIHLAKTYKKSKSYNPKEYPLFLDPKGIKVYNKNVIENSIQKEQTIKLFNFIFNLYDLNFNSSIVNNNGTINYNLLEKTLITQVTKEFLKRDISDEIIFLNTKKNNLFVKFNSQNISKISENLKIFKIYHIWDKNNKNDRMNGGIVIYNTFD